MKLLFENWRKYVNESTEPDHLSDKAELAVHPEANVGQPEDDDNQKLIDIFWGSGVQALQLAEMTGNEEMLSVFKPIVADTKSFIQWIDKQVAWAQGKEPSMSRGPGDDIFMSGPEIINNKANKKAAHIDERVHGMGLGLQARCLASLKERNRRQEDFADMVYEAGDYIWAHGTPAPSYNVASPEAATRSYKELKAWTGA